MKRAASGVAKDSDGCAKKPRVENQGATGKKTEQSEERGATDKVESQELASILKAIERSNARVVEAMEKNTRAVKDEERMMGRVLAEVAHVSRVLDRWEKKDENKENRPAVKSIVTSVTGKKH